MLYKLETKGKDILKTSNNLSWGTSSDTLSSQLSFDSLEDLSMGQIVKFFIDGYEVFRGVVVLCTENKFYYNYTCFDYSFYLKNEVVKKTINNSNSQKNQNSSNSSNSKITNRTDTTIN